MSNYVKATNFTAKDALLSGNPSKIVKGQEIDAEFNSIATAIATKADTNSPTFTGIVTASGGITANITGNITGTSTSIANSGGWNVTPSGTTLYFNYNGTNVAKLDSSGNLTVKAAVISYGTV